MPERLLHPTIVIGYGRYGYGVMRQLLTSTASRGVLAWESRGEHGRTEEQQLKDLALVWVPGNSSQQDPLNRVHQDDLSSGPLQDLYRQIQPVHGSDPIRMAQHAEAEIMAAADRLLHIGHRNTGGPQMRLGLDVVVLIKPSSIHVLGTLKQTLQRAMRRLGSHPNLQRDAQSAHLLNFILIMDFDHYWDLSDPKAKELRAQVHHVVKNFEEDYQSGGTGFSRVYLMDGHTEDGKRDLDQRIDETSLLLEFMLYEGQRNQATLRRIFQRSDNEELPIGTVGIRMMERSSGLLSRLAGGLYATQWLAYLVERGGNEEETQTWKLDATLEAFRPVADGRLDGTQPAGLDTAELDRLIKTGMDRMRESLIQLTREPPESVGTIQVTWTQQNDALMREVGSWGMVQRQEVIERQVGQIGEQVSAAVTRSLESEHPPTIGRLIDALRGLRTELETQATQPIGETPEPDFSSLASLLKRYHRFRRTQVHPGRMGSRWWPAYWMVLTLTILPLLHLLAGERLASKNEDELWFPSLWNVLNNYPQDTDIHMAGPMLLSLLISAVFSGLVCFFVFHTPIRKTVVRAREFYLEGFRGRFADALTRATSPGGALRVPIDHQIHRMKLDLVSSLQSERIRELDRVIKVLELRQREMDWLATQLHAFVKMHGVDPATQTFSGGPKSAIRAALHQSRELQEMMRTHEPNRARFREDQRHSDILSRWSERFNSPFLFPLDFLDDVSRWFVDPMIARLGQQAAFTQEEQENAARIVQFIRQSGEFQTGFMWPKNRGVSKGDLYAVVSKTWRGMPGVETKIRDIGVSIHRLETGPSDERCYLLRLALNVPTDELGEGQ